MTSDSIELTLNWNDYHHHLATSFSSLLQHRTFSDVTLACDGRSLAAHRLLLATGSTYLRTLLADTHQHTIVILKDVSYDDMDSLLGFMYNGRVNISENRIESFLKTAESLGISGLAFSEADAENRDAVTKLAKSWKESGSHKRVLTDCVDAHSRRIKESKKVKAARVTTTTLKHEIIDIDDDSVEEAPISYNGDFEVDDKESSAYGDPGYDMESWMDVYNADIVPIHQSDGTVVYPCKLCDKTYNHESTLRSHYTVHSGQAVCTICGKTYNRKQDVRRHQRTLHGIVPIV